MARSLKAVARKGTKPLHAVILAAGLGKRMKSGLVKVLHEVAGRPMLDYVLDAVRTLDTNQRIVVVGNQADAVREHVAAFAASGRPGAPARRGRSSGPFATVLQKTPRGTGHAVLQARSLLKSARGDTLVLNGDLPGIRPETLKAFVRRHRRTGAAASLLTAVISDPAGYGRIVRAGRDGRGRFERIVEHRDATAKQREIREINAGAYCFDTPSLFRALARIRPRNRQKEYYLTDVLAILLGDGKLVDAIVHPDPWEVLGVNSRGELATVSARVNARRVAGLMEAGVTVIDPSTVRIGPEARVGRDTVIHPGVSLHGGTTVGKNVTLGQGCVVTDATIGDGTVLLPYCVLTEAAVGESVRIGPFAHLRPGATLEKNVHIGNYVEVKKSRIGAGSKANHLTYIGDADVGSGVNVGAGTITCNYDGIHKHLTVLEDGVFVGSDTTLVAPVRVGRNAYIGAGSTITEEVPAEALGIARGRQRNVEEWVTRKKEDRNAARRKRKKGA